MFIVPDSPVSDPLASQHKSWPAPFHNQTCHSKKPSTLDTNSLRPEHEEKRRGIGTKKLSLCRWGVTRVMDMLQQKLETSSLSQFKETKPPRASTTVILLRLPCGRRGPNAHADSPHGLK